MFYDFKVDIYDADIGPYAIYRGKEAEPIYCQVTDEGYA